MSRIKNPNRTLKGFRAAKMLPHVIWWKWESTNGCTSGILWNLFQNRVGMHILEGIRPIWSLENLYMSITKNEDMFFDHLRNLHL